MKMNEQQIVDTLKANKHRPLWDMTPEEVEVLKKYKEYVGVRSGSHPYEFNAGKRICIDASEGVYRLFSDFEIPTTEKVWREFDIVPIGNRYLIEGIDLYGNLAENFVISIDQLCEMVNFGGVKFEGQKYDEWSMDIRAFTDRVGCISYYSSEDAPAIPIKARFWMEQ